MFPPKSYIKYLIVSGKGYEFLILNHKDCLFVFFNITEMTLYTPELPKTTKTSKTKRILKKTNKMFAPNPKTLPINYKLFAYLSKK